MDPLADKYSSFNPYNYVLNNPLIHTDPDGRSVDGEYYDSNGNKIHDDGINDGKVYLTTQNNVDAVEQLHDDQLIGEFVQMMPGTKEIGTKNEFGLIEITSMGHPNITDQGNNDVYSYTDSKGKTVAAGTHGDSWATPETAAAFYGAIDDYISVTGDSGVEIGVGDASAFNPSVNLGHTSHFTGESIDMRFISVLKGGSNNVYNLNAADLGRNAFFVHSLRTKGFTKNISDKGTVPGTIHFKGHVNHLHTAR